MDTVSSKPLAEQGQDMADKAAGTAQSAIQSTQRAADNALDSLSSKVEDLRGQAAPLLNRVSSQAEAAARRGIEAVRDTSQQLREKALRASDSAVGYVKDEPIKAMLIAAATGALLMGLVGAAQPLFARLTPGRGLRDDPPASSPDRHRAAGARRSCRGLRRPGRR